MTLPPRNRTHDIVNFYKAWIMCNVTFMLINITRIVRLCNDKLNKMITGQDGSHLIERRECHSINKHENMSSLFTHLFSVYIPLFLLETISISEYYPWNHEQILAEVLFSFQEHFVQVSISGLDFMIQVWNLIS